jgi:hypothetical protein
MLTMILADRKQEIYFFGKSIFPFNAIQFQNDLIII